MFAELEAIEINVFFCLLIIAQQPRSQLCENTLKSGFILVFAGIERCVKSESECFLWGLDGLGELQTSGKGLLQ